MSETNLTGHCLCGAASYRTSGPVVFTGVCHCKDCQRATGSAFSTVAAVPTATVTLAGETTTFVKPGDSGQPVTRKFCSVCGSTLTHEAAVMPGLTMIEVGTLDDPAAVTPGAHIYCRSKLDWVSIPAGVGAFEVMPPMP